MPAVPRAHLGISYLGKPDLEVGQLLGQDLGLGQRLGELQIARVQGALEPADEQNLGNPVVSRGLSLSRVWASPLVIVTPYRLPVMV